MPKTRDDNAEGQFAFQQQCLAAHNALRKEYGCPPLKWSPDLAESAQTWADKLAERGRMLYSEIPGIGENIVFFTKNGLSNNHNLDNDEDIKSITIPDEQLEIDGNTPVSFWARERDQYDYEKGGWQRRAHNFTQMIWKSSVDFGVGEARTKDGESTVVVAFYKPAGNSNKKGDFAKNVPKTVAH